jgi:hypothetical protein
MWRGHTTTGTRQAAWVNSWGAAAAGPAPQGSRQQGGRGKGRGHRHASNACMQEASSIGRRSSMSPEISRSVREPKIAPGGHIDDRKRYGDDAGRHGG